jgi:hypothetical protein
MTFGPTETRSLGTLVVLLLVPIYLASDPEGRRIVSVLDRAEATPRESGMSDRELDADDSRALRRLVRQGVVCFTGTDRYFLNRAAIPKFRRSRFLIAAAATIPTAALIVAVGKLLFS